MRADHHRHRQIFSALLGAPLIVPQVPPAVQAGAHPVAAAQLHAMEARIAHAGVRVLGHHDAVGDVGARVLGEVVDDGQLAQIDLGARLHHLAHRSVLAQDGREAAISRLTHSSCRLSRGTPRARAHSAGDGRRGWSPPGSATHAPARTTARDTRRGAPARGRAR